jgi:hypothetical protein
MICPLGLLGWRILQASTRENIELFAKLQEGNWDSCKNAIADCREGACGWWCKESKCCGIPREA